MMMTTHVPRSLTDVIKSDTTPHVVIVEHMLNAWNQNISVHKRRLKAATESLHDSIQ